MVTSQCCDNRPQHRDWGRTCCKVWVDPNRTCPWTDSTHRINPRHNTSDDNWEPSQLLELGNLLKPKVSRLFFNNLYVTRKIVLFIYLRFWLIARFDHDSFALWYLEFRNIHTLCWLNVNIVLLVNRVASIQRHTTNLAHLFANLLNHFTVSCLMICDYFDVGERRQRSYTNWRMGWFDQDMGF